MLREKKRSNLELVDDHVVHLQPLAVRVKEVHEEAQRLEHALVAAWRPLEHSRNIIDRTQQKEQINER